MGVHRDDLKFEKVKLHYARIPFSKPDRFWQHLIASECLFWAMLCVLLVKEKNMPRFRRIIAYWLPLAVVITGLCVLIYAAVQQNYRMNANDPQIQLAEDAAAALDQGAAPSAVIPQSKTDIASSLAPFVMVFDKQGQVLASSGTFEGSFPVYPIGALTAADKSGENRVTWQPQPGLRFASVVHTTGSGYVVAARSLREVENRIQQTTFFTGITWLTALAASLILILIGDHLAFPA